MLAVLLAAIAATLWGSGDFVAGLVTRRVHVLVVSLVAWTTGLLLTAAIVAVVQPGLPSRETVVYGLLAGTFGAVGLGALYRGLAVGRMGIVAPIAALSSLVPMAAGFLQGDRPSTIQYVGMVAALGGATLAATAPDHDGIRRRQAGLGLAVLAAVAIGVSMTFVAASAAGGTPVWTPMLLRTASVPLIVIAILVVRPGRAGLTRGTFGMAAGVGVADNLANVAFAFSTTKGLLTLVSVVASLVPVVTVILARFVDHEHLTRHQLVGVVLALGGVAAIAAG
jgi:drug/metabolite transporter (DMT)-like permease